MGEASSLDRTIYPAVPLHVEYSLTELGRSVTVPLAMVREPAHAVPAVLGEEDGAESGGLPGERCPRSPNWTATPAAR